MSTRSELLFMIPDPCALELSFTGLAHCLFSAVGPSRDRRVILYVIPQTVNVIASRTPLFRAYRKAA